MSWSFSTAGDTKWWITGTVSPLATMNSISRREACTRESLLLAWMGRDEG